MKSKSIVAHLDGLLKPIGFSRHGTAWNRSTGPFIDVVDVQTSKSREAITVNAGVLHRDVYAKCWEQVLPQFIEEPSCTVRARIGQLIDGKDLWWDLTSTDVADDIADKVASRVIPFLEQMHAVNAMEQFLTDAQVVKQKYPPPIIYLAILKHEQGDSSAACALLNDLQKRTVGAWITRIRRIAEMFACS
ncbi:MAG: DUF4304 domain-containing protein [Candidatus Sumerlaeaceae bacterium]